VLRRSLFVKILVVDDSLTMRRIVRDCLKQAGFEDVEEAENGSEALRVVRDRGNVSLVLSDWHMPVMDGLALVKAMAASPDTSGIPVILVTSEREKTNVVSALRAGARDYIVKPFTPKVLGAKVESILAASREQQLADRGSNLVGRIGDTAVSDLLQLMTRTGKSGALELESGGRSYRIYLDESRVVAAEGPDRSGEDAFFEAFGLSEGTFSFVADARPEAENITRPLNALLIDAVRRETQ
jgi:two-component system chemotaxis response regulator CheY